MIKNNNPLNIRDNPANNWQGRIGENNGFVSFDTMEHGVRAACKILDKYNRQGFDTLDKIISRWAPPTENPTDKYVAFISSLLNIPPYDTINLSQDFDMAELIVAMSKFENGTDDLTATQAIRGVKLARTA